MKASARDVLWAAIPNLAPRGKNVQYLLQFVS
jgi:hypothetical protein